MVVVDTSVWIGLYRKQSAIVARRLSQLVARNEAAVCGPVWVEFVGGFRSPQRREEYAEMLGAYPWLDTPRHAFELAATWCATYAKVAPGEAIIAATAFVHDAALLTTDRDFGLLGAEGLRVELAR